MAPVHAFGVVLLISVSLPGIAAMILLSFRMTYAGQPANAVVLKQNWNLPGRAPVTAVPLTMIGITAPVGRSDQPCSHPPLEKT